MYFVSSYIDFFSTLRLGMIANLVNLLKGNGHAFRVGLDFYGKNLS